MDKISFFSADYRDSRVHIGGKSYPAGTFATHLLNQFYENDTAARIGVFTTDNWQLEKMLRIGYVNISDYVKAGERMVNIFTALPWLKPFDMLGTDNERNRIEELFSEENGETIIWHGIMDAVYRQGNNWFIIDYKTNADPDELDLKYEDQLTAYSEAFEELTGNTATTLIYHIEV